MVSFNGIIREDNIGRTISEDGMVDAIDIEEILEKNYGYLYDSIKETNYKLKVNHCTYFKEIIYNKKVVGFCAYTILNSISNLSLVASYILQEYRAKGLFFDEINQIFESGKKISIYEPPRFIIELLINYGFAKVFDKHLVVSSIKIDVSSNSIDRIMGSDSLVYEDYIYSSRLYDLNLCAPIVIKDTSKEILYLSKAYSNDVKEFNCEYNWENINEEYSREIFESLKENKNDINIFLGNIENNLSIKDIEEDTGLNSISFEDIKKIQNNETKNELKNLDKIEHGKNTLLRNEKLIDKMEYIKSFQNVAIYNFIKVFEENNNLDLTNSIITIDYEFQTDYIKNLVISEGYISNKLDENEFRNYVNDLKVNELKDILKENDLTVTGNKNDLINRILEYVPAEMIANSEYHITNKGFDFIKENEDIEFYDIFLKNFYYYEFKQYLLEHEGNIETVSKDFLKEHLRISVIKKDNKAYNDSINSLAFINELDNNIENGLYYELKKFIIGLNPVFLDEELYNYYQPINKNNIDNIQQLLNKKEFNLEHEFKRVWNNMEIESFLVPYKKSFSILNNMLSGDDRDYMNDKIREEYLTKGTINHDKLDKSKQSTLDRYF